MEIANIHEAKSQLSKLVERALQGEEIVIARAGTPVVRLVPIQVDVSPRLGGQWKGRIAMADDFDTLPDDLAEAFGMSHGVTPATIAGLDEEAKDEEVEGKNEISSPTATRKLPALAIPLDFLRFGEDESIDQTEEVDESSSRDRPIS